VFSFNDYTFLRNWKKQPENSKDQNYLDTGS